MPIAMHTKPHNASNALCYALQKPGAEVIGGSLVSESIADLLYEIMLTAPLNRDIQRYIYHGKISIATGSKLADELWEVIAQDLRDALGYLEHPYILPRHVDEDHDHVHLLFGRLDEFGVCPHDSWDHYKIQLALREIEERYGLPVLEFSWQKLDKAPSFAEVRRAEIEQTNYEEGTRDRPPEPSVRARLVEAIQLNTHDHPTLPQLVERLQRTGIEVKLYPKRPGKQPGNLPGISFSLEGVRFAGSNLGKGYSLPGLQKYQDVTYDSERDDERLANLLTHPVPVVELDPEEAFNLGSMLPPREDSNWPEVRKQIETTYCLPIDLVEQLYHVGLLYADRKKRWVFVESSLDNTEMHGLSFDGTGTFESFAPPLQHPNSRFWLHHGEGSIDRVVVANDPFELLALYAIDNCEQAVSNQSTLYLSAYRPAQLPLELIRNASQVLVCTHCNDAVKALLSTKATNVQMIDSAHEHGWVGQWQQIAAPLVDKVTVQVQIEPAEEATSQQLEL